MESNDQKPLAVYSVTSTDSPEFTHFTQALSRSSVIGLDAEWKPLRSQLPTFPTVSLLQVACRLRGGDDDDATSTHRQGVALVFLLDLFAIPLPSIYGLLKDVFVSPDILKLGFRFKQDLVYLSSTFCAQGCNPGFDRVEPFMDITSVYNHLQTKQPGRMTSKQIKSLSAICKEVLNITLSKELQCSDWSCRPLTEEQKAYAAEDAHCLLKIFFVFQAKVMQEGNQNASKVAFSLLDLGLKEILQEPINKSDTILRTKFGEALNMVRAAATSEIYRTISTAFREASTVSSLCTAPMDEILLRIVMKFGDKLLLKESEKKPKAHRKKGRRKTSGGSIRKGRESLDSDGWEGPPPWEISLGGDGCPKFLCDVMVEGLAKHLRCVGIDAAVPHSRKPDTRELIDQVQREKRVLLTRDAKLLRHGYLIQNQIYRVKSLLKNEQLLEVIETFKLKICEDRLMSRCTKCNGMFIQKPLSTEEAVEAAKGFQVIPNCLFDKDLQFWQCMDCNQLYWEGTQYHNAVQKFIDVCKLNDQPEVI